MFLESNRLTWVLSRGYTVTVAQSSLSFSAQGNWAWQVGNGYGNRDIIRARVSNEANWECSRRELVVSPVTIQILVPRGASIWVKVPRADAFYHDYQSPMRLEWLSEHYSRVLLKYRKVGLSENRNPQQVFTRNCSGVSEQLSCYKSQNIIWWHYCVLRANIGWRGGLMMDRAEYSFSGLLNPD